MIKVMVPHMPTAEQLLPFLRRIDEARVYVNNGPLVRQLEISLSAATGAPCAAVSNGTVSLELALRAMLPRDSRVLVPAVTYVASGQAIVNAGMVPVICDVDPGTWQLDPALARKLHADGSIHAAMPVATFGQPAPIEPWEKLNADTSLPVLIDAAGALYGQQVSRRRGMAVSYSLHATKALGAGEGGIVASWDMSLLDEVRSLASFGPGGTNAKMSEYHAAVGLASLKLDGNAWRDHVRDAYASFLPGHLGMQTGGQERRTLLPVLLPDGFDAAEVSAHMRAADIETKLWYRPFLDERQEFAKYLIGRPLPVADMLRQRLLGLPFHHLLSRSDVRYICETLSKIIEGEKP